MIIAWLTFFDGLLGVALSVAGIIGAHFQLMPSITGFYLVLLGLFFSVLGVVVGFVAIPVTFLMKTRAQGRTRAVLGFILSLLVVVPIARILATRHQYPAINDITTDTKNAPEFVPVGDISESRASEMKYDSSKYASVQQSAVVYRDLAPLQLKDPPEDAFKRVAIIAGEIPDWHLTYTGFKDHTIEGYAVSPLFRFKDDFVIQVRPGEAGGSLVEMRSKSRDGKGDLGANYDRIESFFRLVRRGQPRIGGANEAPSQ